MDKKLIETTCVKCGRTILSLVGLLICDGCNKEFETKKERRG